MLVLAISLLFTLTGIIAVLAIADSLIRARTAYARLMREAAAMQHGSAGPQAVRLRPTPHRFTAGRRPALRQPLGRPVCAAA